MKTILVTGGSGFIGSHFIDTIINRTNYDIVNLDALTYAGNEDYNKLFKLDTRYSFIQGDITNRKDVEKAMKGCDMVVNFAAESHVDRSIEGSSQFVKTNVLGTQVLLDVAKDLKVEKFIQIGTDEVYGSIDKGWFREYDMLNPSSPYSASKTAADLLALSYYETHGLPVVVTRSCNNYGKNQYPEKLIPLMCMRGINKEKMPVYGNGLQKREWIYVKDNCEAILHVLKFGVDGEVYNIGTREEKTNIDIVKRICDLINRDYSLIEHVEDRLGHDVRYAIDSAKIHTLGWKPRFHFNEEFKKTIEWYNFQGDIDE